VHARRLAADLARLAPRLRTVGYVDEALEMARAAAGLVVGTLMGPSPSADPAAHPRVVVQSGDTLWSIAEGVEGAPDTATAVADIAALNGLPSHAVAPGQVLELPRY